MRSGIAGQFGRIACLLTVAVVALGANAAQFTVLLDTDNNVATGCAVPTPGGSFAGAEVVLTTQVDTTTSPPTVGAVTQQACTSPPATLGAATAVSPGGWSVGMGTGTGGYDVIETYFPVGSPTGNYRAGFVYSDAATGTDELVTVNGVVGGAPIIFAFASQGGVAIPTLSDAGIMLLALLICIVAARSMRRYKVPTTVAVAIFSVVMASAAIAAIALDGLIADWAGVPPLASDQTGDAAPGSDIAAVFAKHEPAENRVYIRADVRITSLPAAVNDTYAASTGAPLNVPAAGVLANDTRGIPTAGVASFGGGSAGGTVTTNVAGATATFGAGGSLRVNADGSFSYTPATGFTGPFTFGYRIANANGPSTAQVTVNVSQPPAITSAAATTFNVGIANTFTVTATGFPAPTLGFGSCAPALPAAITFTDNGNGTGTLAGNPPSGSAGVHACTVSATNLAGGPVNQGFTLTIIEGPVTTNDAYTVAHDTVLTVPAGAGLLANDTGTPAPTVTSVTGSGPACTAFPCTIATTNGSASVQADGSFTYTPNAAFAGTDGFGYVATNTAGSTPGSVTLTVTSDPPVADLNGPAAGIDFGPAAFTEGGGAIAIVDAAQLTLTDTDSATLASATVVITNLLDGPAENLAVTCPDLAPGCSGAILAADVVFTPATGTLAVTRVAPLADYQALLRTLTYDNSSLAPTTTNRDITVTVNDGIGDNAPVARAPVTFNAVNNAPTITAPATAVTPVNAAFNFAATVSVADPDAGTADVQVTLTATNGTATLSGTAGLVVAGNGTATVTATGPVAAMNTALTGMLFTPTAAYSGAASLAIAVNDQGNTGTGGPLTANANVAITVDNSPSVASTVPANGAVSVLPGTTITVNFSEAVTVTGTAFTFQCPAGAPMPFTVAPASPAASFVLTPSAPLPATTTCTLTVVATQVTDSIGQSMAADFVASFTTNTRPAVTTTVPANAAPAVLVGSTITVNFSESVNASPASFTLECPAATPRAFTLSASPAASYVLTPVAPLPAGTTCAVTVVAANVTDVDSGQAMTADFAFGFTTATPPAFTSVAATTFLVGVANSYNVTANGNPVPALGFGACAPALPAAITFTDNGNGTGTLAGNPPSGSAAIHACTASATNAAGGPVNQGFTLTIIEAPVAANDAYTVAHDTVLTEAVGTGLLANDSGSPTPTVTSVTGSGPACTVFPCTIATTNGNATVQADGSFSYTPNAAFAGTDGFSYTITNAGGSSSATVTIGVTNGAPVVDLNGPASGIDFGPAAFTEGGGAIALVDAAQLTLTDTDSATLASATVVITNLLDGPAENLAVTCPDLAPGCSGAILAADVVFTPATGTLAVTRVAPLADYQALLRTLTYDNSSLVPTTTARDITVAVNDGIGDNAPVAHATVALTAVNGAPTITAPATAVTPVNAAFNFAATASVADPDAGTADVQVTLTATNGTATLSGTAGLVVAGNGTATVTATGPVAAMNTALTGLLFTPTAAYSGAASLAIAINDQGNTGTGGPLTANANVAITVDNLPTILSTVPANGAVSVPSGSTITVNFSEAVTVTGTAFTLQCPVGTPIAFTVAPASPAASFVLTPGTALPAGVTCTLTVVAAQVTDSFGQSPAANLVASFTVNTPPTVTSVVPANAATGIAPNATVTVNFSESVNATGASFTLQCPVATPQAFTISASPSSSFTITPTSALPVSIVCTLTVVAAQVTDADAGQAMAANFTSTFTVATPPTITSPATATFTVGSAGTFTVTTTGSPTPAITRTGTLPANLAFVDNGDGTATISGTPAAGTQASSPYAQVITATNVAGNPTQNLSLRVCPVITSTSPIAQPTRTNAYSQTLVGSGGTGPYTFAVTGGALPANLSLSAAGAITGTVTASGAFGFTVTATDSLGCTGATVYAGTINEPPIAGTDAYDAVGNTMLEVASPGAAATPKLLVTSSNVLSNDNNGNGGGAGVGVTTVAGTFASSNGGSVTMATNGTFTYLPPAGFTGVDSFTYTVSDGIGTAIGTVNLSVAHRVWYVRNNAGAGDGRSTTPLNTLAAAVTASAIGDTIYVFLGDGTSTSQEAGAVLKNTQRLVGQGAALDVPGIYNLVVTPTLQAAGSPPLIRNATGNGVTLALDNTLKGFNLGTGTGTAILGASVGALTVSSVSINSTGSGVDLTGIGQPTVNVVLTGLTSSGGTKNVNLAGLAGTVNLGGGALSGSSGHAFDVSGAGTANITFTGTISNSSTGARVVSVANKTGGTVALSGAISSSGANPAGVVLTTNTGTTINLTGGVTLNTGTNPAFTATGGGTVTVTGVANTLATTTATALNVANTTIGAANLTFRSISAGTGASGPVNGIIVNNTGALGRLVVTGNGGSCTVATPTCTGGQIQRTSGDGILLTSTNNASFGFMNIHHNLGSGIRGTTLNGFVLESSLVTDNADAVAVDESGVELIGLTGTAIGGTNPTRITNSTIQNNFEFELQITNTAGTLTDLQMSGNTISSNGATGQHGNLFNFLALGTANMTLTLTGGTFTGAAPATATGVQCDHSGTSGTTRCNVSGATFTNNNVAVSVSQANGGNLKFNVDGNTATGNRAHGLNLFVAAVGTGTVDGSFLNNVVGSLGTVGSGSSLGFGIRVQNEGVSTANPVNVLISGNTVQETASFGGINVNQGIAGQASSKTTNVTVTNNVIREVDSGRAIVVQQNNSTNPTSAGGTCVDVSGNNMTNIAGQAGDGTKVRFRKLDANGGVFNVRQTSIADLAAVNSPLLVGEIAIGGTPTFAQSACPQPVP